MRASSLQPTLFKISSTEQPTPQRISVNTVSLISPEFSPIAVCKRSPEQQTMFLERKKHS